MKLPWLICVSKTTRRKEKSVGEKDAAGKSGKGVFKVLKYFKIGKWMRAARDENVQKQRTGKIGM